jgi:hypothetical protein
VKPDELVGDPLVRLRIGGDDVTQQPRRVTDFLDAMLNVTS